MTRKLGGGAVVLCPLSTARSGGSVRARPAARAAMGDDDDAEEEARLRREARLAARHGAGRRLRRRCALCATLTLVVLYLACVDRYPPDDAFTGETTPPSAQFGNDTHHADARHGVRRSRRAIAWHPPLSANARVACFFGTTPSRRVWRTSPRWRSRGRSCVATVLATARIRRRDEGRVPDARPPRALLRVTVATCVALTAKGVAHLPDLDDSAAAHAVFWAAWLSRVRRRAGGVGGWSTTRSRRRMSGWCWHRDAKTCHSALAFRTNGRLCLFGRRRRRRNLNGSARPAARRRCWTRATPSPATRDGFSSTRANAVRKRSALGSLLLLSAPDAPLLSVAFVFLVLYAVAAASVPHFTGELVDAVAIDRDPAAFKKYSACLSTRGAGGGRLRRRARVHLHGADGTAQRARAFANCSTACSRRTAGFSTRTRRATYRRA